jgi:hypothetical protein
MLGVESMRVAIDIEASKQRVAPDGAADYKGDAYAGEKVTGRDSDSRMIFESTEVASARSP